ncbi:MAG: hypothetical protein KME54_17325 [Tolypothrix brevis GSE-NOS-MK-07-07A]|jgi:hypothetical protein|nr:hypothetical protein [Tolypothrix brevis GSE-NOS-MK-07-07A]
MAAGRHHSAWAEGFKSYDVAELQPIELSEGYEKAIADSWRCMIRFLPDVLPLSEPNLSRNIYKLSNLDLGDFFGRDEVEFLQLYSLVVRALRLCDQRSVQLM